ncbi:hypothetical protein [Falsiroseomonas sp. E2-1-a20]|uniref:hypothetical protein n=1 Tax=Falsiroseomonas sp. E2-1-a20 TaxID=3239300 RepID=UPI003F2BCAF6
MPIAPDSALLARRRDLERDLDRMLELRGPVDEIRRLVAEIDLLAARNTPRMTGENSHAR